MNIPNADASPVAHLKMVSCRHAEGSRPLVSVVVCSYRHEAYIRECLDSVNLAQGASLELIVIDDGSSDETLQICCEYEFRSDLPYRIFGKSNSGLIDSLRSGLLLARGRYVTFIASDDYYYPAGLRQVTELLSGPAGACDVLICQSTYRGGAIDGLEVYGERTAAFFSGSAGERAETMCTEYPAPMLLQSTIFDTEFLRRNHPWNEGLGLDDWPTFIRVFLAEQEGVARVRYLPSLRFSFYRVHVAGLHNNREKMLRLTEEVALKFVPENYRKRCLANVRIDRSLVDLYEGRWVSGLLLFMKGLFTHPSWNVASRVIERGLGKYRRLLGSRLADRDV